MAASVLFDEPGPHTRRRHRLYSVVFLAVLVVIVGWVLLRLKDADQLDPAIAGELFQSNNMRALRDGVVATLKAAAIAVVLAVILGALLAVARLSDRAWVRAPARLFVEFFRAVPLLLLIVFFGVFFTTQLPIGNTETRGLIALVTGLTLYNGSVLAEVFRAGINAVPKGQAEAAYAVGLRKSQVMKIVLMPQAVRFMLPAIISQCVIVLKDTSLGFVVVYPETLRQAKLIAEFIDNQLWTYAFAALIYIALNSLLGLLATWLEKRASASGDSSAVKATESALPMT